MGDLIQFAIAALNISVTYDDEEAERALRASLHCMPRDPVAWCNLAAAIYSQGGRDEETIECALNAIRYGLDSGMGHYMLAKVASDRREWADVRRLCRIAIERGLSADIRNSALLALHGIGGLR